MSKIEPKAMKKQLILISLALLPIFAGGQVLTQKMIVAAVDIYVHLSYSMNNALENTIAVAIEKNNPQLNPELLQGYTYEISHLPCGSAANPCQIEVYTNPSTKFIWVESGPGYKHKKMKLALFDLKGKNLFETSIDNASTKRINVEHYSTDSLILVLLDETNHWMDRYKITKVKL